MDAWRSYPGAPTPGTELCDIKDIRDPGTYSVYIGDYPILIARRAADLWAYVNACPHQFLPLDFRAADVFSQDASKLICSNHEAAFDVETGTGLSGYGTGCELDPIPIEVTAAGIIKIAKGT